jgi:hypothetical protein
MYKCFVSNFFFKGALQNNNVPCVHYLLDEYKSAGEEYNLFAHTLPYVSNLTNPPIHQYYPTPTQSQRSSDPTIQRSNDLIIVHIIPMPSQSPGRQVVAGTAGIPECWGGHLSSRSILFFIINFFRGILHPALQWDDLDLVKFLVHRGAQVNGKNEAGETPFMVAVKRGFYKIIRYFLTL